MKRPNYRTQVSNYSDLLNNTKKYNKTAYQSSLKTIKLVRFLKNNHPEVASTEYPRSGWNDKTLKGHVTPNLVTEGGK